MNSEKLEKLSHISTLTFSRHRYLEWIFQLTLHWSGKMLMKQSHTESPWLTTSRGEVIKKDTLEKFFKDIENFPEYFLGKLQPGGSPQTETTSSQSPEIQQIFKKIKEFVAAQKNSKSIIRAYDVLSEINSKKFFKENNLLIDGVICDMWPGQSPKDILLGSFFFPQELEELYEPAIALYGRDHILTKLAYSAKHGNLLALYHLSSAFKLYEGDWGAEESEEENHKQTRETLQKLRKKLERKFKDSLAQVKEIPFPPYFSLGQLYNFLNKSVEANNCFERGYEQNEFRATCAYANFLDDNEVKIKILKKIENQWASALLELAQLSENLAEAYTYYCTAGERGVSEGHYRAALMIMNGYIEGKSRDEAIDFLKNRLKGGAFPC